MEQEYTDHENDKLSRGEDEDWYDKVSKTVMNKYIEDAEKAIWGEPNQVPVYTSLEQIVQEMTEAINIPNTTMKVVSMQVVRDKIQATINSQAYIQTDGTK